MNCFNKFVCARTRGWPARRLDERSDGGFKDPRYGVKLPPGFTIFRHYKGKRYSAQAVQGFWISSEDGKGYGTLNELNKSIGITGAENAWNAWSFQDGVRRRTLSELRDPGKIVRRA